MIEPKTNEIREINTDYIQTSEQLAKEKARKTRGVLRRMIALTFIFAGLCAVCIMVIDAQNHTLKGKQEEKEQLTSQLDELTKQQKELEQEIKNYNDLDYIAEVARRDYFLTKEGEILFKVPKSTSN